MINNLTNDLNKAFYGKDLLDDKVFNDLIEYMNNSFKEHQHDLEKNSKQDERGNKQNG